MSRKVYQTDLEDGPWTRVTLDEDERERIARPVQADGGINRWLRLAQQHLQGCDLWVSAGMVERAIDYAMHFGEESGGFQQRIPLGALRRAGLIPYEALPLFD